MKIFSIADIHGETRFIDPASDLMRSADIVVISGQYNYCVKAVYSSGESAPDCELVDVGVGIPGNSAALLQIYPNPATDRIRVTISGAGNTGDLVIRDLAGRTVLSAQVAADQTVDVSSLRAGIYIVTVHSEGSDLIGKIAITK